jgi:tRNA modification GTPase
MDQVVVKLVGSALQARRATLVTLVDPRDGGAIDRGIAVRFVGPASYTGDDVVELDLHGSPAILEAAVAAARAAGARPAGPGEFTRRAVLHGKLDLVEAEAVDALINADSLAAARAVGRHLEGELSRRLGGLRTSMLEIASAIEALLDFPEEVDDADIAPDLLALEPLAAAMEELASTFEAGVRLTRGLRVVLAGPVNAGKSTLFNLLLGHARAITSEVPGTTRDVVSETVTWGTRTVRLEDTAGRRPTIDPIESEGIARSLGAEARADLVIEVRDGREVGLGAEGPSGALGVATHADLLAAASQRALAAAGWHLVGAPEGTGVRELRDKILAAAAVPPGLLLHTARQHAAVERSAFALRAALQAGANEPVLAAVSIRAAGRALEELLGAWTDEEVLDTLFDRFCIGK